MEEKPPSQTISQTVLSPTKPRYQEKLQLRKTPHTHFIRINIQTRKPPNIKRPRRNTRRSNRHAYRNLLQQHIKPRVRIPTPQIRTEPLSTDKGAPRKGHVFTRSRGGGPPGEVVESLLYGLLMQPRIHFARAFLGAEEVFGEGTRIGNGYEGVLPVVDVEFAETAA